MLPPSLTQVSKDLTPQQSPLAGQREQSLAGNLEQQARTLYEAGRLSEAVQILQQALQSYRQKGDTIGQAIVLSNLSLSYQQLGAWAEATQAIDSASALLQQTPKDTPERSAVWAQALDVQGSLQLAQGKADKANESWKQANELYTKMGDTTRATLSRINQAQALQALGLYRQALLTFNDLEQALQSQPDSLAKAANLRSLGDALGRLGKLDCETEKSQASPTCARKALAQSLNMAQRMRSAAALPGVPKASEIIATANLSLGNVAWAQSQVALAQRQGAQAESKATEALNFYQQAMVESVASIPTQAQLNRLRLLVELKRFDQAQALYPQVQQQIAKLPPGRAKIYAQVNLAISLRKLSTKNKETEKLTAPSAQEIAPILAVARQQANDLGDARAQALVLEELGRLYQQTQQWSFAQDLTQQALNLSQSINASEISYRAAWQLGRVLKEQVKEQKQQAKYEEAIAAYTEAYKTLRTVRSDLIAANSDVQFSFRESVEPVYRELVDLLLQPPQAGAEPNQKNLRQARDILESLQVAELENYFQQACSDTKLQLDNVVDQKDREAAVVYPIILDDRLEVILKLPNQKDLFHYPPVRLPKQQITKALQDFQSSLKDEYKSKAVRQNGQIVYDWLIKPEEHRLESSGIKTLLFILDGPLRTIPMSALYDGKQFLVEKYAVSLVLGLEVRDPVPLNHSTLKVLGASLTDPPPGFDQYQRLANVNPELDEIQKSGVALTAIRDQNFTKTEFNQKLNQDSFQIVHLATHGQFGADRNSTYILTADGAIYVDQLDQLFRNLQGSQAKAVDLLIFSACRTATGNDRAVLGIAGTVVRAGAQSAIAGLWSLADASSADFSKALYQNLGKSGVTRAEALRQAQLALLKDGRFAHPRYWAPYVLVGSWL
jgi:CHAT domain-containing protein/tetratricopeptide (TPR) repeat protein